LTSFKALKADATLAYLVCVLCASTVASYCLLQPENAAVRHIDQRVRHAVKAEQHHWQWSVEQAQEHTQNGNPHSAIVALTQLESTIPLGHPGGPSGAIRRQIFEELAIAFEKQNKPNRMIDAYQSLISESPDLSSSYLKFGDALYRRGRAEDAELQLLKALKLNPTSTDTVESLLKLYDDANRAIDAQRTYEGYQSAFQMVVGMTSNKLTLFSETRPIQEVVFQPVLASPPHEYVIHVGDWYTYSLRDLEEPIPSENALIDTIQIALDLPESCRSVRFHAITLRGKPVLTTDGVTLLEHDLQPQLARTTDTVTSPDEPDTFSPRESGVMTVSMKLPSAMELRTIDQILVKLSAAKRLSPESAAIVQRSIDEMQQRRNRDEH